MAAKRGATAIAILFVCVLSVCPSIHATGDASGSPGGVDRDPSRGQGRQTPVDRNIDLDGRDLATLDDDVDEIVLINDAGELDLEAVDLALRRNVMRELLESDTAKGVCTTPDARPKRLCLMHFRESGCVAPNAGRAEQPAQIQGIVTAMGASNLCPLDLMEKLRGPTRLGMQLATAVEALSDPAAKMSAFMSLMDHVKTFPPTKLASIYEAVKARMDGDHKADLLAAGTDDDGEPLPWARLFFEETVQTVCQTPPDPFTVASLESNPALCACHGVIRTFLEGNAAEALNVRVACAEGHEVSREGETEAAREVRERRERTEERTRVESTAERRERQRVSPDMREAVDRELENPSAMTTDDVDKVENLLCVSEEITHAAPNHKLEDIPADVIDAISVSGEDACDFSMLTPEQCSIIRSKRTTSAAGTALENCKTKEEVEADLTSVSDAAGLVPVVERMCEMDRLPRGQVRPVVEKFQTVFADNDFAGLTVENVPKVECLLRFFDLCPLLLGDTASAELKTLVCESLGSYEMHRVDETIKENNLRCCMTQVGVSVGAFDNLVEAIDTEIFNALSADEKKDSMRAICTRSRDTAVQEAASDFLQDQANEADSAAFTDGACCLMAKPGADDAAYRSRAEFIESDVMSELPSCEGICEDSAAGCTDALRNAHSSRTNMGSLATSVVTGRQAANGGGGVQQDRRKKRSLDAPESCDDSITCDEIIVDTVVTLPISTFQSICPAVYQACPTPFLESSLYTKDHFLYMEALLIYLGTQEDPQIAQSYEGDAKAWWLTHGILNMGSMLSDADDTITADNFPFNDADFVAAIGQYQTALPDATKVAILDAYLSVNSMTASDLGTTEITTLGYLMCAADTTKLSAIGSERLLTMASALIDLACLDEAQYTAIAAVITAEHNALSAAQLADMGIIGAYISNEAIQALTVEALVSYDAETLSMMTAAQWAIFSTAQLNSFNDAQLLDITADHVTDMTTLCPSDSVATFLENLPFEHTCPGECTAEQTEAGCSECDDSGCTACATGYTLNSENPVCDANEIACTQQQTDAGCTLCTTPGCAACGQGYTLDEDNHECDSTSGCSAEQTGAGCTECSDAGCTACASGYTLDDVNNGCDADATACTQAQTDAACTACTTAGCSECAAEHTLDESTHECTPATSACTQAQTDAGCSDCAAEGCTACAAGYTLNAENHQCDQDTAVDCTQEQSDAGCSTCTDEGCTDCADGYTLDADNHACTAAGCTSPCSECDGEACTACEDGYHLDGTACKACKDGEELCQTCNAEKTACTTCQDTDNQQANDDGGCTAYACTDGQNNCETCAEGRTACQTCADGYAVSDDICAPEGTCTAEQNGCATCNTENTVCTACQTDFYIQGGICKVCSTAHENAYCTTCNSDKSACTVCEEGYHLDTDGRCKECVNGEDNCATCNADRTECDVCADTYEKSTEDNKCYGCVVGQANCATCHNDGSECATCTDSNTHQVVDGRCVPYACTNGQNNCAACAEGRATCQTCDDGYVLSDGVCVTAGACLPNVDNCAVCNDAGSACTSCAAGYNVDSEGKCYQCVVGIDMCSTCNDDKTECTACDNEDYRPVDGMCEEYPCKDREGECTTCDSDRLMCETCSDNMVVSGPVCVASGSCTANADNCETCNGGGTACNACATGYHLSGGTCHACVDGQAHCTTCSPDETQCTTCMTGYTANANGVCKACVADSDNCATCNSEGSACTTCATDYYLDSSDNKCYACVVGQGNCGSCNDEKSQCTACTNTNTHQVVGGVCQVYACTAGAAQCTTCNSDRDACTACASGYALSAGACVTAGSCTANEGNCQTCNSENTACNTCAANHFLSEGSCYPCVNGQNNCQTCNSDKSACTVCMSGYSPGDNGVCSAITYACTNNEAGCSTCNEDRTACATCMSNYKISGDGCVAAACTNGQSNCQTCASDRNSCTTCASGYTLVGGSCQLVTSCTNGQNHCSTCNEAGTACESCSIGYYLLSLVCAEADPGGLTDELNEFEEADTVANNIASASAESIAEVLTELPTSALDTLNNNEELLKSVLQSGHYNGDPEENLAIRTGVESIIAEATTVAALQEAGSGLGAANAQTVTTKVNALTSLSVSDVAATFNSELPDIVEKTVLQKLISSNAELTTREILLDNTLPGSIRNKMPAASMAALSDEDTTAVASSFLGMTYQPTPAAVVLAQKVGVSSTTTTAMARTMISAGVLNSQDIATLGDTACPSGAGETAYVTRLAEPAARALSEQCVTSNSEITFSNLGYLLFTLPATDLSRIPEDDQLHHTLWALTDMEMGGDRHSAITEQHFDVACTRLKNRMDATGYSTNEMLDDDTLEDYTFCLAYLGRTYMEKVPATMQKHFCMYAMCADFFDLPSAIAEGVLDFCVTTEEPETTPAPSTTPASQPAATTPAASDDQDAEEQADETPQEGEQTDTQDETPDTQVETRVRIMRLDEIRCSNAGAMFAIKSRHLEPASDSEIIAALPALQTVLDSTARSTIGNKVNAQTWFPMTRATLLKVRSYVQFVTAKLGDTVQDTRCQVASEIGDTFSGLREIVDKRKSLGLTQGLDDVFDNLRDVYTLIMQACHTSNNAARKRRSTVSLTCDDVIAIQENTPRVVTADEITAMSEAEFSYCQQWLGMSTDWSSEQLVALASEAKAKYGETVSTWDELIVADLGSINYGLTEAEIGTLTITKTETIQAVGERVPKGASDAKMSAMLDAILGTSAVTTLTSDQMYFMDELLCAMDTDQITAFATAEGYTKFCRIAERLGKTSRCAEVQLQKWAEIAVHSDATCFPANVGSWKSVHVSEIGVIIGGLTKEQLATVNVQYIPLIKPDHVALMPAMQFAGFTVDQLQKFTSLQAASVTSAQYNSLTPDQQDILDTKRNMLGDQVVDYGNSSENGAGFLEASVLLVATTVLYFLLRI